MNYDDRLTLSENIFEQNSTRYDLPTTKYKTFPSDATSVYDPRTKQVKSTIKSDVGYDDSPKNIMDTHEQLAYLSFGSYLFPVVGPYMSLGFDLMNSLLYYLEDDYFMFGFTLALSVIPIDDILKIVAPSYKINRENLKSLIKKLIQKKSKFTDDEIELIRELGKKSNEVVDLAKRGLQKIIWNKLFKTMSLKQLVTYVYLWSRRNTAIYQVFLKMPIKFGSILLTYEELAKIFGIIKKEPNETLPMNEKEVLKYFELHKSDIYEQVVDSLIPYSDDQQLIMVDEYFKSKY